jgi:nuclear pore complex protein Nup205
VTIDSQTNTPYIYRYFSNLKQEVLPSTDTVYRHRLFNKGITPQEIQGLHAVLELIKVVAGNRI